MMKNITVNGERRSCRAGTLAGLLEEMGLEAAALVAEVNGRIVSRVEYENTPLREDDRVELVRFVGGG